PTRVRPHPGATGRGPGWPPGPGRHPSPGQDPGRLRRYRPDLQRARPRGRVPPLLQGGAARKGGRVNPTLTIKVLKMQAQTIASYALGSAFYSALVVFLFHSFIVQHTAFFQQYLTILPKAL